MVNSIAITHRFCFTRLKYQISDTMFVNYSSCEFIEVLNIAVEVGQCIIIKVILIDWWWQIINIDSAFHDYKITAHK